MKETLTDSLVFLTIARETISEMFPKTKQSEKEYIMNEASDFEIMHILTRGTLPSNKFDQVQESVVFREFKEIMVRKFNTLSKAVGQNSIDFLIFEMSPVSSYGLSSAKPILEHSIKTGLLSKILTEAGEPMSFPGKTVKKVKARLELEPANMDKPSGGGGLKNTDINWKGMDKPSGGGGLKNTDINWKGMAKPAAIGASAAAVGFGAYKLYKKYQGDKQKAIRAQISALESGMSACDKSTDAEKCKSSLTKKISTLQARLK